MEDLIVLPLVGVDSKGHYRLGFGIMAHFTTSSFVILKNNIIQKKTANRVEVVLFN